MSSVLQIDIKSTPYTYILEWTAHNKRYVGARWAKGCHPNDLWNEYFTSSKYVAEFVKIHGDPDIILIDKTFSSPKEAIEREKELLTQFNVLKNDVFLNKNIGGVYDPNDKEIKEKLSKSQKGKKRSDEWVLWVTKFHQTRKRKPETCAKISEALAGKKLSEDHKKKCSLGHVGKTRKKRDVKLSEQQRARLAELRIGVLHSDETKRIMSLSRKGKKQSVVTCPHCDKMGGNATMPRWHFDNCKKREKQSWL